MLSITVGYLLLAACVHAKMFDGYERYFSIGHGALVRTRSDPIVDPGKVATHVHSVIGSSAFTESENYASAIKGQCSTSFIQADMSNYWAPQLYYKYKNGTYYAIQGDGLIAYWKFAFNNPDETFAVVPDDFRMLAGDKTRDHYDPTLASHNAISFQCMGDGFDQKFGWIPADLECKTLRPQAFFPNCWNGKDAYLPDNKHVSYPTGDNPEGGPCPDGFVRIPSVFLEAYYKPSDNVPDFEWYPGCFVFSNGDNTGYSYHSDWLNGWPSGMLVDAYNTCGAENKLQGTVDGCSVFEASRDEEKSRNCVSDGTIAAEPIGLQEALAFLPGDNMLYNSSKASADHTKVPRAGYVESVSMVGIPSDLSGVCSGNGAKVCTDYASGGMPAGSGGIAMSSVAFGDMSAETAVPTSVDAGMGESATATSMGRMGGMGDTLMTTTVAMTITESSAAVGSDPTMFDPMTTMTAESSVPNMMGGSETSTAAIDAMTTMSTESIMGADPSTTMNNDVDINAMMIMAPTQASDGTSTGNAPAETPVCGAVEQRRSRMRREV